MATTAATAVIELMPTIVIAESEDDDLYQLSWIEVVIWCILYGIISFLAFFGNILVIAVTLTRLRNRSITTYFIINLAFADLFTALFAIPFKFQAALFQVWHLPASLCQIVPYVETVALSVSVFTLTASAVHEFRTVFFPKQIRMNTEKARVLVVAIWVVALVVSLPHGLFHAVYVFEVSPGTTIQQCRPVYADEDWWKTYNIYLFVIHYFVPMLILDTAYTLIAVQIYTTTTVSEETRRLSATPQTSGVSNRQLMKMLIIVVAVFTLCWMPLECYLLINEVLPQINEWRYINVFFFCAHWLAMSNSCLNPIIYGLYNTTIKFDTELESSGQMNRSSSNNNNNNSSERKSDKKKEKASPNGLLSPSDALLSSSLRSHGESNGLDSSIKLSQSLSEH